MRVQGNSDINNNIFSGKGPDKAHKSLNKEILKTKIPKAGISRRNFLKRGLAGAAIAFTGLTGSPALADDKDKNTGNKIKNTGAKKAAPKKTKLDPIKLGKKEAKKIRAAIKKYKAIDKSQLKTRSGKKLNIEGEKYGIYLMEKLAKKYEIKGFHEDVYPIELVVLDDLFWTSKDELSIDLAKTKIAATDELAYRGKSLYVYSAAAGKFDTLYEQLELTQEKCSKAEAEYFKSLENGASKEVFNKQEANMLGWNKRLKALKLYETMFGVFGIEVRTSRKEAEKAYLELRKTDMTKIFSKKDIKETLTPLRLLWLQKMLSVQKDK